MKNDTIVEIFEWQGAAVDGAHTVSELMTRRKRYTAACDYVPLYDLLETLALLTHFEPIDLI